MNLRKRQSYPTSATWGYLAFSIPRNRQKPVDTCRLNFISYNMHKFPLLRIFNKWRFNTTVCTVVFRFTVNIFNWTIFII